MTTAQGWCELPAAARRKQQFTAYRCKRVTGRAGRVMTTAQGWCELPAADRRKQQFIFPTKYQPHHNISPYKSQIQGKKTAPGIPRTVLQRAEIQLRQKSGGGGLKPGAFFLGAVSPNLNRFAVIQAKHSHKAFGVDTAAVVANQNPEGLDGGQFHKILHIGKGMQRDIKLLHGFFRPLCCTKGVLSCIM